MSVFYFLLTLIICLIIVFIIVIVYMYSNGGIYKYNKSSKCFKDETFSIYNQNKFCDIQIIKFIINEELRKKLLFIGSSNLPHRVNIPGWKAGKTVDTSTLIKVCPKIIEEYKNIQKYISNIIGEDVYTTSLSLKTSCVILVYDEKDDFINWHYDVNYYKGRFFTLLIPITKDDTCTSYIFKNNRGEPESVKLEAKTALLFEGEHVFHMASKLCQGQKRIILSMQFTTNNELKRDGFLLNMKNMAY